MIDYRQFFHNSLDLLVAIRSDGRILLANAQCCRTLGYRESELDGQPLASFVHPADRPRAGQVIADLTSGSVPTARAEFRLRCADGRFVPVEWTLTRADAHSPIYATGHDATEAQRVRQEHSHLARIALSTHNAVVITDPGGHIEWVNEGFTRLTEYSFQEVVGRIPGSFLQGPETDPATVGLIRTALRERRPVKVEIVNYSKSGRKYWLGMQIEPLFDEGGELQHFMAIELDIDERKRQDEELRMASERQAAILDAAGFAIIAACNKGITRIFNRAAERMLGYSAEEVIGKVSPAAFHLHEQVIARAAELTVELGTPIQPNIEAFTAKVARGIPDIREWTYVRKDGTHVPALLSIAVLHDAKGEIAGYLGIAADMTAQHEAEAKMKQAQKAAETAARLKSEFLANMSHEIRTPMNGILGFTHLLRETALQKDQREYVDTIHHCADSLLALINDVLDYSKIEAGMLVLDHVACDLPKIVADACEILSLRIAGSEVELIVDWSTPPSGSIFCDPVRLRQVLLNLLGNAIKFTEKGHVLVKGRHLSPTIFRVEVIDTGIGIQPDKQRTLFQKFVQADASTTRRFGGTGLGLAISRQLIEGMGGEVGLESQFGVGSTFWFTLPVSHRACAVAEVPIPPASSPHVLIVDDHPINRRMLEQYCEQWGFRAVSAASGAEGLDWLEACRSHRPFDVAIVDQLMPGLDGIAFARHAAESASPYPPLVLLSSTRTADDERWFGEEGFSAVLHKPLVRPELLREAILRLTQDPAGSPRPAELAPGRLPPSTRQQLLRLSLLLAEDNAVNQRLAERFLQNLGCQVEFACDGLEAIAKVRTGNYDAVLMDCQMPRMDGFQSASAIRPLRPDLPIIAVTANALSGDRERCAAAGMNDYIAKPFTLVDLLRVLEPIASRKATTGTPSALR